MRRTIVNDRMKLLAYRVFDPSAPPLLAKQPVDLTPQIAARVHELHEHQDCRDGQPSADWLEAGLETRNDEAEE